MPRWKRRRLGTRVMSRSKSVTEPASGAGSPVIRLKSVVFPAPLGPMMSRRSPGSTTRLTPEVTRSPPNDLSRPRTASALSGGPSDHLPGSQLRDLGRAIPELGQDLVRVLAQGGRAVAEATGSLGQIDRRGRERHPPRHARVTGVVEETGLAHVLVLERLLRRIERRRRDLGRFQL